jgi:hypothetical protein
MLSALNALVMLLFFPLAGAWAADAGPRHFENWKANVTANVNLRTAASLGSDVVIRLKANDSVLVRGIKGDWFLVIAETETNAYKGWVHSQYVRKAMAQDPEFFQAVSENPPTDTAPQPKETAAGPPTPAWVSSPGPSSAPADPPTGGTTLMADPKAGEPARLAVPAVETAPALSSENAAADPFSADPLPSFQFAKDIPAKGYDPEKASLWEIFRLALRLTALVLAAAAFILSRRQPRAAINLSS